jgi:creatinine amidohydrolase
MGLEPPPREAVPVPRPFVLAETNWKAVRETDFHLAVLPWGATEAHNLHLPYGTDTSQVEAIAAGAAERAWAMGARCLVLPAVPFGVNAQQVDIPHTVNMNPSTQAFLLGDVVESLEAQGIYKLLVLNGHGGNEFRPMIREIQAKSEVFLCLLDWYAVLDNHEYFQDPGDHAGEMETSLMLHLHPSNVLPLPEAGKGKSRSFKIRALKEGWAWAPRNWVQVTDDTGVGDPAAATAEKGAVFLDVLTARIAEFLKDLAEADVEELYE